MNETYAISYGVFKNMLGNTLPRLIFEINAQLRNANLCQFVGEAAVIVSTSLIIDDQMEISLREIFQAKGWADLYRINFNGVECLSLVYPPA